MSSTNAAAGQGPQIDDESGEKLQETSILLRSEIRSWWVLRVMRPIEEICVRRKISPNAITMMGLASCFICALLFASGHILIAGWGVLLGGSFDFLDGRVARATGKATEQGGFLDSVLDRYQDFFLLAGLAVFYQGSPVLYLVLLAMGGSLVVPYAKARAEVLGISLDKVGAMQRPERVFLIGFGSMVSSILQVALMPFYGKGNPPPQHLLILVLAFMAVSTNVTAIRRIRYAMDAIAQREKNS